MNRRQYIAASLGLMSAVAVLSCPVAAETDLGSAQRVRQVKTALGITSDQSRPWADYVEALAAYRNSTRDVREAEVQLMGGAQAIDDDSDAVLRDRQGARLQAKANLKASYEILYDKLDPAQQQVADTILTAGECGR